MRTDKELSALRVMEALSAVDEELLERSGKSIAENKNRKIIRRFVQKYAAACAACLCLMVLGAAYFGMSRIRMGAAGGNESVKNGGADAGFDLMTETGNRTVAYEPEYEMEEAKGDSIFDVGMSVRNEPEWLDVEQLAVQPGAIADQEPAEGETVRETDEKENAHKNSDSTAMLSTPAQKEPGADADVPVRYSPVETEAWSGEQDSLLYEWSDGEQSLWLRITQTDLTVDLRFNAKPPIYTVQEEWRELIPDAGADGYVQFALLYDNGILAEYCGALDREEIIRLMESLVR